MKLYISGAALILLGLFYLPVVVWLLLKLWKNLPPRLPVRITVTIIVFLIAAAIPLWDVTITSIHMAKLCSQAGLFVKRSVKVDGFYTNFGSPDMLDHGFKYVESRSYGDRLVVYSKVDNAVKKEEFDARTYQVKSRYEFIYNAESGAYQGRRDIGIQKSVVRDRQTGEELGYALRYKAYPGWVDRNTIARIGQVLWMCHGHMDQEIQLRKQVLLSN